VLIRTTFECIFELFSNFAFEAMVELNLNLRTDDEIRGNMLKEKRFRRKVKVLGGSVAGLKGRTAVYFMVVVT
jgi:hypothetical protein